MDMTNDYDPSLGFGRALAQNRQAMRRYAGLTEEERQQVLAGTRGLGSDVELEAYVDRLTQSGQM